MQKCKLKKDKIDSSKLQKQNLSQTKKKTKSISSCKNAENISKWNRENQKGDKSIAR